MASSSSAQIRVRFAPSPTGHLHIGGLRTALFNWLFAKHNKGLFLLRIEDTDRERSTQDYVDSIMTSLEWVGIVPDEPVIIQSARVAQHRDLAEKLIAEHKAYRCICTQEQVLERYIQQGGQPVQVKYDGACRDRAVPKETPHVIRFKIPDDCETIQFDDIIRGLVTVARDQLDDFIIVRSDGGPMYNFVVVVDDAFMRISHVIRGEDHIINTPKQILLYRALQYTIPTFAHIPLVLGPSGQKLSKREAATSVIDYKKNGFFADALVNYLARLGWSHGDQERFTRAELVDYFDLAQVSKSGAIFDTEKLLWLNSLYIRELSDEALYAYMEHTYNSDIRATALSLIALYKTRVHTVKELSDAVETAVKSPAEYHDIDLQPLLTLETAARLQRLIDRLEQLTLWDVDTVTQTCKIYAKELGSKIADLAHPLRVALIGQSSGPGAFALLNIIGKKESLRRLIRLHTTIERMTENKNIH